jgi:hypothetical protein
LFTARKILENGGEQNSSHLATVFKTLAKLYSKMGRVADSKEYAARAEKILKPPSEKGGSIGQVHSRKDSPIKELKK